MWFFYVNRIFSWILDPRNRNLIIITAVVIFAMLFLKQCNQISSLKGEIENKEKEIQRVERNRLAQLDTIRQYYNEESGSLTATIKGYELTLDELNGKYSQIFGDMEDLKNLWKNNRPVTIVEKSYYITEKITGIDAINYIDSLGFGNFSFSNDTIFSEGNSRSISGNFPYRISIFSKRDSSLLNYASQSFFAKIDPENYTLDFKQQMTIFTGLTRDKKTGQIDVWAKTNYPGVEFDVLKGASVQDDKATQEALVSARKEWGLGVSFGGGILYSPNTALIYPGAYIGVGLNYTPKKLQFGK